MFCAHKHEARAYLFPEVVSLRKSRGGCLSAVIFLVVLIACICLIYKMVDASSGGRGPDMIDTLLDRLGYTPKHDADSDDGQSPNLPSASDPVSGDDVGSTVFGDLPDANVIKVELTQEKLLALLQTELDKSFPITLKSLKITADAQAQVEALLERDAFLEYVEENESALEGVQVLLLKLAPEQIEAAADIALSYSAADGKLRIDPEKLTVQGVSIPVSLIPSALTDSFSLALDSYTEPYGYALSAIEFYDGYMQIYIE
jgi:hypothetical protein